MGGAVPVVIGQIRLLPDFAGFQMHHRRFIEEQPALYGALDRERTLQLVGGVLIGDQFGLAGNGVHYRDRTGFPVYLVVLPVYNGAVHPVQAAVVGGIGLERLPFAGIGVKKPVGDRAGGGCQGICH